MRLLLSSVAAASAFSLGVSGPIDTTKGAVVSRARCGVAPVAAADFSETRRKLLPPALFSLLGGRLLWLANNKEEVALPQGEPRFDVDAASAAIDRATDCAVQSCYDVRLEEQAFYLNTVNKKKNQGALAEHLPVVYVEPAFGAGANPRASYRVVITLPEAHARDARLLWLKNAATGQVLASKAFAKQGGSQQGGVVAPPTIIASLLEPYGGVRRGTAIVPYVFYDEDGLFEGPEIVLCAPSECASAPGSFGPSDFRIDTRGRRDRSEVGRELLRKAAAVVSI